MPKVTINDISIEVADGTNVVQAAEQAGFEVPHYCYHPGLSVAGNCRMCLVDIRALSDKQNNPLPKLQIGCNTIVQEGMVVETENEKVREARQGVLEFLLINHPIDCPICDQAGECKLQEYYMDYGRYGSRFALGDKVNKEKATPIGPDVMLDQERCILCTRCVRFLDEVTESHELTVTERGDHSELTLATGEWVDNAYATNIVDICPVGALTSREFRFQARVWYLESSPSICAGCSTGCGISVHERRGQIYRIKPRYNEDVNGFWMCDAGRRTAEDNAEDRVDAHLVREGGPFVESQPKAASRRGAVSLQGAGRVAVVASAQTTVEEAFLLSRIQTALGGGERIVVSPAESEIADDGRLISTDRFPNRRGLLELGFREGTDLRDSADCYLIARADPVGEGGQWASRLENAASVVVLAARQSETLAYADVILAASTHFESDGSFMNRSGLVQSFAPVIDAPGQATAGWVLLAWLLEGLESNEGYSNAEEVTAAALLSLQSATATTEKSTGSAAAS